MDLAAIYGPSNPDLVKILLQRLLDLQPRYWGDIALAAAPLAGNLRELSAACGATARGALGGDASACAELAGALGPRGARGARAEVVMRARVRLLGGRAGGRGRWGACCCAARGACARACRASNPL